MTQQELDKIVERHQHWLKEDCEGWEGMRANLRGADLDEKDAEIRRLKRALWLARAWSCGRSSEYFSGMASRCKIGQEDFYREVSERARRYMKSSYKCRAKAEEFK